MPVCNAVCVTVNGWLASNSRHFHPNYCGLLGSGLSVTVKVRGSILASPSRYTVPQLVSISLAGLLPGLLKLPKATQLDWTAVQPAGARGTSWCQGYLEGSAVPINEGKLHQLVDYLDKLLSRQPLTMTRLLLERDALLALLMWETSLRGINCGRITLLDFFLPGGQAHGGRST